MRADAFILASRFVEGCWMVFGLFWMGASLTAKPTAFRQGLDERLRWLLLLSFAVLILLRSPYEPYPLNVQLLPHGPATAALGALVCACGLAFTLWARLTLGRNWSGRVTLKVGHELIQHGPYRLVRHPIYTGLLMMVLATAVMFGRAGAFLGVFLFFVGFWIKLRQEETLMLKHFPQEYPQYQRRVKRIIPWVL